jgi:DNA-binding GntR family transcriptional regulator
MAQNLEATEKSRVPDAHGMEQGFDRTQHGAPKQSAVIRQALENLIVNGDFLPGDRLDEETLAARFMVSRTPIREALLQLQATGLIDMQPRRSARVCSFSVQKIIEAFEFNAEIETICIRFAVRRMTKSERVGLKTIVTEMRRIVKRNDVEAYAHANRRFHLAIHCGSHNGPAETNARMLSAQLAPYHRQILMIPTQLEVSLEQHDQITRAVVAGDENKAATLMKEHVGLNDAAFRDFIALLSSRNATGR